MTTILAVRNPLMMFADSLTNDGDMKRLTKNKIQKIHIPFDGDTILYEYKIPQEGMMALVGASGESQSNAEFYFWCKQGLNRNTRPRFDEQHGINGLLLLQSGILLRFDHQCFPFEIEEDYYAVGTGRDFVIGALEAYFDSEEYVTTDRAGEIRGYCEASMKIAAKYNIYTCEPIHQLSLP